MDRVLSDIRILDFGRFIACPFCGMMLADMGAEVIRIDRPGGEEDRTVGLTGPNGENMGYPGYARNKKGITLNIFRAESRPILADLVKKSDVVIHNFAPEAARMAGLTYEELKEIKPDIILTAISCFGSTGPYADRTGFDFIAQAMSGAMKLGGYPDKPPVRAFINPMDFGTGTAAAFGTMVALRHRDQTGEGQAVDLSLLQTALCTTAASIAENDVLGIPKPIIGNRAPYVGPTDMYKCKDGYVFIATIMNSIWKRLVKVIGAEHLLGEPELKTDLDRYNHRERIDPLVVEWMAARTTDEAVEEMQKFRIPCGPLLELPDISKDPHIRAENMLEYSDLEVPGMERIPIPGIQARLSKTPGKVVSRAPRVGEHNQEIYKDLLGYQDDFIQQMTEQRII
jgi:crotonobetainyl-CoA:carnitine CoA-transferase CaiB-like acyl-CoA transferase